MIAIILEKKHVKWEILARDFEIDIWGMCVEAGKCRHMGKKSWRPSYFIPS